MENNEQDRLQGYQVQDFLLPEEPPHHHLPHWQATVSTVEIGLLLQRRLLSPFRQSFQPGSGGRQGGEGGGSLLYAADSGGAGKWEKEEGNAREVQYTVRTIKSTETL